ncbi:unnamed protein product [Symbiodinium sp. CCMP2592]|nr:unnamed protein product [Symbiodinium sp. CCMP2592]
MWAWLGWCSQQLSHRHPMTKLSGTVRLPTPPRAMASSPVLWALWVWWIFTASAVPSASTEFFRIRSALAPHKCITSNSRGLLWLRECSTSARGWINPHHVWSFNKTWLVNLKQLEDAGGTLQAMCVTFDRAYYYHHGRPLRLRACQDGQASMDWVWEGERIRHAHSPYVFDLAGHNLTNLGGNRHLPDDYGWFGFPAVQLGAEDASTSSDQVFFREILTSLENLTQSFEPLPATEALPDLPREQYSLCPDGSFGERNVCPDMRRRARTDYLCRGGTLSLKCVCFPGYFPLVVGHTPGLADLGYVDYTCCRGEGNSDECGDNLIWFPLAVALTVLGVLGVLTTSLIIHCYHPSIAHATEEDLQVLCPQHVHDGAALHRTVEQAKWGVSLEDLRQFRRLVHHEVKSGSIRPTDRDQFALSDVTIGPSAYTVNDQMIRPITAAAGNVSWALMKHPEGCLCDLFITHGWAEGMFDFVEKVVNSWPRAARGAYVCFLSNPQNLDIADLLQSPRESPFARALSKSSSMLVVPNHVSSIYTRIWCVYEAFLASSWDKPIRLAKRPLLNQWPRILRVLSTGVAAFGTGMLYPVAGVKWYGVSPGSFSLHWDLEWAFAYVGGTFGAFVALTFKCCFSRATATIQMAIHCMTVFLALSVAMSASWLGLTDVPNLFRFVAIVVGSTGLEADWQRATRALRQADQLAKDFKGTVRHATSSSADDLRRILRKIEEHEQVDAIDDMVASLMATNVSTAQLHSVVQVTGHLKDLSGWSRAIFLLTVIVLIFQFRQVYTYRVDEDGMTIGWLLKACAGLEALLWPIIFLSLPVESKALAERCAKILLLLLPGLIGPMWQGLSFDVFAHLCVIPLFMVMATVGWRISRVPVVGPALIRMLFVQSPCPPKTGLGSGESEHPHNDQPTCTENEDHVFSM